MRAGGRRFRLFSVADRASYDEASHWHAATCGHDLVSEQGKHEWNEQNICSVCGYGMQYTEGLEYRKTGSVQNAKLTVASIGTGVSFSVSAA